jgi:phosphatidylglycerophosphate synthase
MKTNIIIKNIIQKNDLKEFYSKYFSVYFANFLSLIPIKLKIHPNLITISMIPLGLSGSYFIFFAKDINNILIGCLFYIFLNIIDTVDGQVARYANLTSKTGKLLDYLSHFICDNFIFIALIHFLIYKLNYSEYFIIVSLVYCLLYTINFYYRVNEIKVLDNLRYFNKNKYKFIYFVKSQLSINAFVHIFFLFFIINFFYNINYFENYIYIIIIYLLTFFFTNLTKILLIIINKYKIV